ncbi:MAG: BBP7 family outer membrane beta-barrel protein [Gemmataceae bacterium]
MPKARIELEVPPPEPPVPMVKPSETTAPPAPVKAAPLPTPIAGTSSAETLGPTLSAAATVRESNQKRSTARWFASGEVLFGSVRQGRVPALVSTAAAPAFGFFADPSTTNLLGPGGFSARPSTAYRIQAGWVPLDDRFGFDATFTQWLEARREVAFSSDQYPTLARPIFALNIDREFAELAAAPGLATGQIAVESQTDVWSFALRIRRAWLSDESRRLDWFVGFKTLNLLDTLRIREQSHAGTQAPEPVGTRMFTHESFETINRFYGGQFGWSGSRRFGRATLDGRLALALGFTRQTIDIEAMQTRQRPGLPAENFNGGILANPTNIGRQTQDQFSFAPEAGMNLGFYLTPQLRLTLGYDFQYWSRVLRPGETIDRNVDLTYLNNAPVVAPATERRPELNLRSTDFWTQGLRVGAEFAW